MSVDILLRLREQQKHAEAGQPAGFLKDIWQCAADEIEQLRSDLALLGPVTTPTSGLLCAFCIQEVSPTWTYCPYCGAQERNTATGEALMRRVVNRHK